ncbi:MAG: glycoside hydrolase family 9 protein [Gemmatimonadota bacterium]
MDRQLQQQIEESRYLKRGLRPDLRHAAETRWLAKPVLESRPLSLAAAFSRLELKGPGRLSLDHDCTVSGQGSARLTVATAPGERNRSNRAYAVPEVRYRLEREDLRRYNRLSLWIRADAPGFHNLFFVISVHNEGEHVMPVPGRFEGSHYPSLSPGAWHQVVWEIPYLYRDCVSGISMGLFLMGSLPEAADEVSVCFDGLELQVVEEESYLGFDLRRGSIAYCHSGYRHGARKQALVRHAGQSAFCLRDADGREAFRGEGTPLADGYLLLDFSALEVPGRYTLHIGARSSGPFPIGDEAWIAAAWKTLSFFYTERCGTDVPGVHGPCHLDAYCAHPDGRRLSVAGGWHDAADMTQGLTNTAESAWAMLSLAEALGSREGALRERLLEEARWGLNWVMGTRFGDGYRHTGLIMGIWTKNTVGDGDDMSAPARHRPLENLMAAALWARAAALYVDDPVFARWCLTCARQDFAFGLAALDQPADTRTEEVVLYAQAAIAAAQLHVTTGEPAYLDHGARFARVVLACQQRQARSDLALPLRGFFYEDRTHHRALAFFHRSYEHAPVEALCRLRAAAPDHPDAAAWSEGLELYGAYVRATAGLVPPYGLLPNAIYEVDNTDYSGLYHEGDRSVGAPTLAEYNAQVRNGIRLSATHYLRRFPVAYQFRGFHGTLMGRARAAALVAGALGDRDLRDVAVRQMEWIVGFNPFAASSVYGEGYDYPPLYVASTDQLVGAVPVGFETFENLDLPFFPMQNAPTYKEIWVHATCRLMWLIADLLALEAGASLGERGHPGI